ncbi:hypothetical protein BKA62DRAFT_761409 [Auriculariales sp. MPI-PUGE-AT-0066]|nr:hypothetical protein BKA62DRAFT_761409 [Auriculariales sp. MPI-PUGE-AT-0066]
MPPYSRDQLVALVSDLYTFLTTFHIPENALVFPPPGGWPNITPEKCAAYGKSPFVIDLLAHLPYISQTGPNSSSLELVASSGFEEAGVAVEIDRVPPHVVVIAKGYESGGRDILIDTEEGTIIVEEIRCGLELNGYYRDLGLIIIPGSDPIEAYRRRDGLTNIPIKELPDPMAQSADDYFPTETDARWIRLLYRSYGWPTASFRKEEALRAVAEYVAFREQPFR